MKPMHKKALASLVNATLFLPLLASAQNSGGGVTIGGVMQALAGQVVLVATWIVVIMWVVTGILFLTAVGKPEKVITARTALFASIAGTILVIIANGAVALVKNSLGL